MNKKGTVNIIFIEHLNKLSLYTMITDKIKMAPNYAKEDADIYAYAEVDLKNLTPERVWRNLINISAWPRLDSRIVDIQFEDDAQTDPHLFDKAKFNFDLASGEKVRAVVIDEVHPKDDRTARLAIRATAFENGDEKYTFVMEFIVGVPDHKGDFMMATAVSVKDPSHPKDGDALRQELLDAMLRLGEYSRKHD